MHIATVYKINSKGEKRPCYRLCESYRTIMGQPRKRMLCALGYLEEIPTLKEHQLLLRCMEDLAYQGQRPMSGSELIDGLSYKYYSQIVDNGKLAEIKGLMEVYRKELERKGIESVNLSTLKNIAPRETGAEHVCVSTLKRLGVEVFLMKKGWTAEDARFAVMQIASRAIYPVSELKTVSYLRENSALCELLGIDPNEVTHHRLYRSSLRLYGLHEELENHLHEGVCTLFDIRDEILLFDLTNTYFEGRMKQCKIAKFGRSKERRSDCRIVVLAVVVNAQGMVVRTRIFEGNRGDCTTLQEITQSLVKEQIRKGKDEKDITIVMDAGIATKDNLACLRANHFRFVTVARSTGLKYSSAGRGLRTVLDSKKQEIRLESIVVEGSEERYLLVDSQAKTAKERSMYERSCQYFEEGLEVIRQGIYKKGGTKKLDRVCERLERLKNESPTVWKDYMIEYDHDEKNTVTDFRWQRNESRSLCSESKQGKYVLHSNLDENDEENIWSFYNVIRQVEATFRCLKTDLDLRPVYHKGEDGTKAHLHLAILACWVASTASHQLRQSGIHHSWSELVRILQTHKIVSTRVSREDESQIEIRQCTEPNEQVLELYRILKLSDEPLRRRKFVVHPEQPPNKTTLERLRVNSS